MNNQYEYKYAYSRLSPVLKEVYDSIKNCFMKLDTEIKFDYPNLFYDDIVKVVKYILIDCPEIFWYKKYWVYYDEGTSVVTKVTFEYSMKRSRVLRRQRKIEKSVQDFLKSVDRSMSEYETVKQIYENVITLVDYDSVGLAKSERRHKKNPVDDLRSIYGVIVKKKAVCAGYARAMQYLLNRLGIECVYVSGRADDESHAWNLVKVDGDYYYLDTTWGDGSDTKKKGNSEELDYDYFCVTTADLSATHTPNDVIPLPRCTATKCNYHVRNGLFFGKNSYNSIKETIKSRVEAGELYVTLKFADEETYDTEVELLIERKMVHEIIGYVNSEKPRIKTSFTYYRKKEKRILDLRFYAV